MDGGALNCRSGGPMMIMDIVLIFLRYKNGALMEVSGRQFALYIKVGDYENREYSRECGGMTGAEKPRRSAFSFLSHPHYQNFPAHPKNFTF